MGLKTIGLSGRQRRAATAALRCLIVVPSPVTASIQEMHITIGHMLCKSLEQRLGLV
jgi:D-sedoheptulose 7-phosphate isomerase